MLARERRRLARAVVGPRIRRGLDDCCGLRLRNGLGNQLGPRFGHGLASAAGGDGRIMDGMLVIELANVLAGPSVGQFLAELGARVIKIESPVTNGDVTRTWKLASEKGGMDDVTAYFSCCNLGKESVKLDLTKPEGVAIMHDLAKKADVMVASFKPGDAEKLQADSKTLRKLNNQLIYAQITGYSHSDPRVGYDAVVQAESGFQYMNGTPGSGPCKMPVALIDVITAHQLKEGILVELWRRERTKRGGEVFVSLMSSAVSALANQATGYLREGAVPQRLGSDHPTITPYGTIFETDRPNAQITLGVGADSQFRKLCEILGKPEWGHASSKFATNPQRCDHREELKKLLAEEFVKWNRDELLQKLNENKIPGGGVNDMRAVFEQPLAQQMVVFQGKQQQKSFDHLSSFSKGQEPVGLRQIAFFGTPEGMDNPSQMSKLKRPPSYGIDTENILREVLDYNDERIAQARGAGAIG